MSRAHFQGTVFLGVRGRGRRLWRFALSCLAAILAASLASAAAERISEGAAYLIKTCACSATPAAPVIDGDPRDACWQHASVASDFVLLATQQPAKLQTTARLLHDDRNLYIAVTCVEPNVEQLSRQWQPRDGGVWFDDSVEVFLDCNHDHATYFQFIVSAAGSLLDGIGHDNTWQARGARWAAHSGEGSWSVELLVPFADLGVDPPSPGDVWGLNIWRNNYASAEGQSQWSCTAPSSEHTPLRFGDLVFGQPRYALQSIMFGDVYQGRSMIKAQLRGYAGAPADVSVRVRIANDSGGASSTTSQIRLGPDGTAWLSTDYNIPDMGPAELTIELGTPEAAVLAYRASYPLMPLGWWVSGIGALSIMPSQECYAVNMPVAATVERVSGSGYAITLPSFSIEMAVCDDAGERVTPPFTAQFTAVEANELRLTHEWDISDLPDGRYAVGVQVKSAAGELIGASSRPIAKMDTLYAELGLARAEAELAVARPRAEEARESAFAACTATAEFYLDRARAKFAALSLREAQDEAALSRLRVDAYQARRWTGPLAAGGLPFAEVTGRILRASRSRIDGTLQPYSVFVPSKYDPRTPCPLVLVLHPFDPDYGPFWEEWIGFYEWWAELRGHLLLCPFARGNQDFRGIGEADLWQVYEETERLYRIDPDRVYVTGISMGGTGTWHVAARYPDRFAALAAVAGRGGNIRRLGLNLANVPAYVVHGGSDDIVPPQHSRVMTAAARAAGARAFLSWHPLAGHVLFPEENRNAFDWFAQYTRRETPREVRYRTETLKYDRCHWVRIDALGEGRRTPEIEAAVDADNVITVGTVNIDAYTLAPPPALVTPNSDITINTNGVMSYRGPMPGESVSLRRVAGSRDTFERVPDGAAGADELRKRHGLQGPICDAFTAPFLYVYGTGEEQPELAEASEEAARMARDTMQAAAHGSFPIKSDAQVTPEDIASYNLILYGSPAVNGIVSRIARELPIRLQGDRLVLRGGAVAEPSVGVKMVYPNPLAPGKYLVVNLGTDGEALRALAGLRVPFVDYVVVGRRGPGGAYQCLRDGHFDQRWQLPRIRGSDVHVITDTSWRCHRQPPTGWTAPGFNDANWPLAAAHSKGLWPDINFATHFDDRAVAIWYPEDDPDHVTRYFRRSFELPGPAKWARATVLVEDECDLYVNGLRVRRIAYEDGVTTVSLRRYLQPGRNVLAVKAYEAFGDQCVVIDCAIKLGGEDTPA